MLVILPKRLLRDRTKESRQDMLLPLKMENMDPISQGTGLNGSLAHNIAPGYQGTKLLEVLVQLQGISDVQYQSKVWTHFAQ